MRPLDPRLLRYARSIRVYLAAQTLIGLVTTACVIGFAAVLTRIVTGALDGDSLSVLGPWLGALVGVAAVRALTVWASETLSMRAAGRVKAELRGKILDATRKLGPSWLARRGSISVATLSGRGMDALDDYFAKYLPQLILTALVTPILVVVIWWQDWVSGIVVVVTLPLIPFFMALVGWATQSIQRTQWDTLGKLSRGFVDLLGGLATLKIFGRQHRQADRMRTITTEYRQATMKVLRVTFLSGFVLELASSLAVAIVAVGIGLRLVEGGMLLSVGLFVLLLAPEVFLPLRNVGTNFHAAAEGVTAAEDAFAILDEAAALPEGTTGTTASDVAGRTAGTGMVFAAVRAQHEADAPLSHEPISAEVRHGKLTVLSGPSGVGKSSLVGALLGFTDFSGEITRDGVSLRGVPAGERDWLAWAPQRPGLTAGTIAENVTLGDSDPDPAVLAWALETAVADDLDATRDLGVSGAGLSGGQAQRVGIARALYRMRRRDCAVLILDEPSSALDHATEARLVSNLRTLAAAGAAVLVLSHRGAFLEGADTRIDLVPIPVPAAEPIEVDA
ncbi:ATP-binding cassette subfamily C protein CydD [Mycetocola sp. BIGb0189]|uniref:thiol reductant ABC exporter subunit CydD n=1 Tax=Mycetocola sp. BIGb0189 TaxID=2940604 RepID=UPI0021672906|nr:thiol reductant ABC exporter subunit CydD [Mycetocola sp. BIGb0189]MCS4276017.1 ATP-binding cassette subfamily C protein CydD [Mycetocola sp. BIGb0189]